MHGIGKNLTQMDINKNMKVSVITVCYNSEHTILDCINSVNNQTYNDIEHIFIDGLSTDKTNSIIKKESIRETMHISEPDQGIYDAMNKGIMAANGNILCILNSDDFYAHKNVINLIVQKFKNTNADFIYSNALMVNRDLKTIRRWITPKKINRKRMIEQLPHPCIWIKKSSFPKELLLYDTNLEITADLKMQLEIFKCKNISGHHISDFSVTIRLGGKSTANLKSYLKGWLESIKSYNDVYGSGGIFLTASKVFLKLKQYINK